MGKQSMDFGQKPHERIERRDLYSVDGESPHHFAVSFYDVAQAACACASYAHIDKTSVQIPCPNPVFLDETQHQLKIGGNPEGGVEEIGRAHV